MNETRLLAFKALRMAARERISALQKAFLELHIVPRMGGEREFVPLAKAGLAHADLLDEARMTAHLREHMPGVERVHQETITSRAQYELVTGPNSSFPGSSVHDASPLATAETLTAVKDGLEANADRLGLAGVSHAARTKIGNTTVSSGLHLNNSLLDLSGTRNLYYQRGAATTDLQRHVAASLIETHATAAPVYFPTQASYERIGSTRSGNPLNPLFWWEMTSGVPTMAGYMSNKGINTSTVMQVLATGASGKPHIGSVAGRHSNLLAQPLGMAENLLYGHKSRGVAIGFEKPHQFRIESRPAGADAHAHAVVTAELASMYEAVSKHAHLRVPGEQIDKATQHVVDMGEHQLVVTRHRDKHPWKPLAANAQEGSASFVQNERNRRLLGEDAYHAIVTATRPDVVAPELEELYRKSQSHVERYVRSRPPEHDSYAQMVRAAIDTMPSSVVRRR